MLSPGTQLAPVSPPSPVASAQDPENPDALTAQLSAAAEAARQSVGSLAAGVGGAAAGAVGAVAGGVGSLAGGVATGVGAVAVVAAAGVGTVAAGVGTVAEGAQVAVKAPVRALKWQVESDCFGRHLTSPLVWWRHPSARIFVVFVIILEDFFIYAEDPVNDSHVEANFPGMGHIMGLVGFWSAETAGLGFLRFFLMIVALILGIVLGRLLLTRLIRQRWKVIAFEGCEGALVTVAATCSCTFMLAALTYNLLLTAAGSGAAQLSGASMELMYLFGAPSLEYCDVNKSFQTLSATVDILAILMIVDVVLQDRFFYPGFLPKVKDCWVAFDGYVRVVAFWVLFVGGAVTSGLLVFGTGKEEGDIRWTNTTLGGTDEFARSLLAACIVFTDLLTAAQDWSFPLFREETAIDVEASVAAVVPAAKVAGTWSDRLTCNLLGLLWSWLPPLPEGLRRWLPSPEDFRLSINGKWMTYGPLFAVMIIDLFCAKTQMVYAPENYGQYVDPVDDRIWVITDKEYLSEAYEKGTLKKKDMITFIARWNNGSPIGTAASDVKLNSLYRGQQAAKYVSLLIALSFIFIFAFCVWAANWRARRGLASYDADFVARAAAGDGEARRDDFVRPASVDGVSPEQTPRTGGGASEQVPELALPPVSPPGSAGEPAVGAGAPGSKAAFSL